MSKILEFFGDLGVAGMFLHSMLDAIIFPIPAFFLQVALSTLHPSNAILIATVGYVGCLIGTPIGYLIGKTSGTLVLSKFLKERSLKTANELFKRHGDIAILIGSFTPIPFKIFTILSGSMKFPLWKLLSYAAIGRAAKFYGVGMLFFLYGQAAEHLVGKVLSIILICVGVAFGVVWLLIKRVKKGKLQKREVL